MSERLTEEQQRIVEENMRLALMMSCKYRPPIGMDREDWQSECMVQLAKAVRWHDPAKGTLSTILDTLVYCHRSTIHVKNQSVKRGGRCRTVSIDGHGKSDCTLGSFLGRGHDWEAIENHDIYLCVLRSLSEREACVVQLKSEGLSHRQIGLHLGVSQQRVTEILYCVREKLATRFPYLVVHCGTCKGCGAACQRYSHTMTFYCTVCSKKIRNERKRLCDRNRKLRAACA